MIGGKVLDPSALAAYVRGSFAMDAWLVAATRTGIALYLPNLALAEVRAVYPDADLAELVDHPWAIRGELGREDARKVARLLAESGTWDATAGHVILVARQRGWPVLSADMERLQRIAPDLDVDLL